MQQLNTTKINYYLSLMLIFFLQGCASTNNDQQVTPQWVLTPAQDTAQYIYGIGEGRSLEEAKQHALKALASKFSVSVNSDTLHKQSLHNGRADELFSQEINTHVKAIEFTHFEQIKAEQVKQQYYMLVAINRQGFINNNKSKLAAIRNDISTMLAGVDGKSKIEKLYVYNKLQKEVAKAAPLLYLIAVADSAFDMTQYSEEFYAYSQKESELLQTTKFTLKSDKQTKPISHLFADLIETNGFQVTDSSKSDSIIELSGKVNNSKDFSTYNSRIDFSFKVKSKQGKVYSKKAYTINGSSITSHQIAYENAIKKFLTIVKTRSDIYQILGFEE